ncbi:hypothetical protein SISSUDRAFT_1072108 [Sistotremastrum suecicum HHB10207 ss-3]|uniref:Rap-GAP domain-containing protein n=1 Tax=Sistotremastrum suecicum HHB10207 ss-3 TaxID=1314776 RepID=A0A165ZLL3_9AGAM|nr:hypothetical protein SISSUDRAFT_1072108 [Sistotremastrum suecicum HHB10207 ss-3]
MEDLCIEVTNVDGLDRSVRNIDFAPVIDTHNIGIIYIAPGQTTEAEILANVSGSPTYNRFLDVIGKRVRLDEVQGMPLGGLRAGEDGDETVVWGDEIARATFHVITLMPNNPHDPGNNNKKRHIGNDYVRIIWNGSGFPYRMETIPSDFNFVNIIIEPHSLGSPTTYPVDSHDNEYFKVTMQLMKGMPDFVPIGEFKIISSENLPYLIRRVCIKADWFCNIYQQTGRDTSREEYSTNWRNRLRFIKRLKDRAVAAKSALST